MRYRPCRLSAFDGQRCWGIEDQSYNGDNLVRDWRYKGRKRKIWRGTQEEAQAVAQFLSDNPEILAGDRRRNPEGVTQVILAQQRRRHLKIAPPEQTMLDLGDQLHPYWKRK